MRKIYNFGAGPAMLPEEVLRQAQEEMLDWKKTGWSVMEIGHRGPEFSELAARSEADLRELMNIPNNYKVIFLAGGASTQFAMVPLNLFTDKKKADYVDTGIWSKKAIEEAKRYGQVHIAAQTAHQDHLAYIPHQDTWTLNVDADYVHYTPNETIGGIEFHWVPDTGDVPLVADMTSMILSRPIAVNQFGIIYAGAQKNIGQAGLTIVIIREDLIKDPLPYTPTLYSYKIQADNQSFYNTPPTYAWYIASLVFAWMKRQGGVAEFAKRNKRKADKLYGYIDQHKDFYINPVLPESRSQMNVAFSLLDDTLTDTFLREAKKAGLYFLKGHRLAGGLRASMYNAMPEAGVDALLNFMEEFAKQHR